VAAVGAVLVGVPGRASAQEHVVVRVAPPAPRIEVRPVAPTPHHVWVSGYWGYRDRVGYEWHGGRWESPHPGYAWEPAHWSERGGYWHFVGGHWRPL
jgi:hypothetical protein